MGARFAILVAFAVVLPPLAIGCSGSDQSIPSPEVEARFQRELRSQGGARGVQVECSEAKPPEWWESRSGEQVLGCTVNDPDCDPRSRKWNLCVDGLGEWSGKAWIGCLFHDPGPMGNDVTCSWIHESAGNDGARGGFSFDAP